MKQTTVKKRTFVLIVSFLAAAAIALGAAAISAQGRAKSYETLVAANYQHAFSELVTAVGEMDTALQKSLYAVSPSMISAVCTEVFGKSMTAQMSLGALPFSSQELERTSSFISRTGDYAWSLARAASTGSGYTDGQLESLRSLSDTAGVLSQNLRSMQEELFSGAITMDSLENARRRLSEADNTQVGTVTVGDGMKLIEREFPETPSLVYDGPFSEHLVNAQPRLLEGLPAVGEDEARRAAAEFAGIDEGRLSLSGERGGSIPCRYFSAESGAASLTIAVTNAGGKILGMISSRVPGEAVVSDADAERSAIRFLESRGFGGMAETYRIKQDGAMTVNFAYKQNGVLCYSDLIKVTVALDTGAVSGFEAAGYVMSHCERDVPTPAIAVSDAAQCVGRGLRLVSTQLALVPDDGKTEKLCYELKCEDEQSRHCLIYVNALTGVQEKLLILLEDETGTLTI